MKHRSSLLALALCLVAVFSFSVAAQAAPLSDWDGTWVSVMPFIEDDAFVAAAGDMAEAAGMSVEELVAMFSGMFRNDDIASLRIKGDTIAFLSAPGGDVVAEANYAAIEPIDLGGFVVDVFEAQSDAPFTYLMLMPAEIDETGEMMSHFHMRYANDLAAFTAEENANWYPTMVLDDTTVAQVVAGCEEFVAETFAAEAA